MRGLNKLYLRISVIHNKKALRFLSELFVKSATTYFHAPFPANYLGHE